MGRLIWPESESRGTLSVEDVPMRRVVVVMDGARVPLSVLPRRTTVNEIRAVANSGPGLVVLLRDSAWGEVLGPELPATSVLDVYKVDDVQAALLECDRKIGLLDEALGPIAGRAGLAIGFTVEVAPDYAVLLAACQQNITSIRNYIEGRATRDPRWA